MDKRFMLHNRQTGEVAYTGRSITDCQNYGIRKGILTTERSKNFLHVSYGWWEVAREDRLEKLYEKEV